MPIKVTLTGILDDLWGAEQAFEDGGQAGVRELLEEDLSFMMESLALKVELVTDDQ